MKKVIVERVREDAKYFCDKHPDRECYTSVKTSCWYGSQLDMLNLCANLCDECMTEFYQIMKDKFNVEPIEEEIRSYRCCFERE